MGGRQGAMGCNCPLPLQYSYQTLSVPQAREEGGWKGVEQGQGGGVVVLEGPPAQSTCFSRTGSNAGSKVSPTSSTMMGVPLRIACSNVLKYWGSVIFTIFSPYLASILSIHRSPCPCGTTIGEECVGHDVLQCKL